MHVYLNEWKMSGKNCDPDLVDFLLTTKKARMITRAASSTRFKPPTTNERMTTLYKEPLQDTSQVAVV